MTWAIAGGWVELAAFAVVAASCGALVLVGIPGIWVMVVVAVAIDLVHFLASSDGQPFFGVWPLAAAAAIALAAEGVEFLAGGAGAKVGGASRGGILGAMIGSMAGAVVGTCTIPVPVIGTLLGAVGGAGVGAVIGEVVGARRSVKESLRPAAGAAAGRLLGFVAKAPFAAAAWLVLVVSAAMRLVNAGA